MTLIYLVVVTDGRESTVVCACSDEATADEIAGRAGGSVDSVLLIDTEAE